MNIYIVTEGTAQTGMGHIGRCIALYDAFCERGFEPAFIVNGGDAARLILDGKKSWFLDWTTDAERLSMLLSDADIVIVDSYLADRESYSRIAERASVCVWIDDYIRLDYPAGIVANGTVFAERMEYPVRDDIRYLLGAPYVILRKEFWNVPRKTIRPQVEKILLTFGGSDVMNLTPGAMDRLMALFPEVEMHVVVGSAAANRPEIEKRKGEKIKLHYNLSAWQMKRLMEECDLAVSAAGQTMNELARCGIPSVVFQVADNQTDNIRGWREAGFISDTATLDTLAEDVERLLPQEVRRAVSEVGQRSVDGQGARRIAVESIRRYIVAGLTMRPVKEGDLMPLFELANDKTVRLNSFNTAPIPIGDHKRWFSKILTGETALLYIFEEKGDFAGQVRFDFREAETVTSIGICEQFRGYGIGVEMLRMALDGLQRERRKFPPVTAYIKPENKASQAVFTAAGYEEQRLGEWVLRTK